ncbi:MAG: DUF1778 domain-containing protein [Myxococcota bacterium]
MPDILKKETLDMAEQTERLDLRVSAEHKQLIERAAAATGHATVSGFAAVELVQAARAALERSETLTLSASDWRHFIEILDRDEANEALRSAAQAYRKKHGA